jgi:hypothetical protein
MGKVEQLMGFIVAYLSENLSEYNVIYNVFE